MRRIAVVMLILVGCIEDHLTPCGELACPVGAVCTPGGCATAEEVAVCAGLEDAATCVTLAIDRGSCIQGACREARCGNGVTDSGHGEACDDGNERYADGCSGDCRSRETCGNAILDRAMGEECDDGNSDDADSCRTTCHVPTCGDATVDLQNGEACDEGSANSNAPGASCRTNCQPQRCGDGVLDAGETCDDGNLISGDDCSGDCMSTEVCGNGYVDVVAGEQCDDTHGAGLSADGCSSRCSVEVDLWRELEQTPPAARTPTAIAFDAARGEVVMFGGRAGSTFTNDTWTWNGVQWRSHAPIHVPPAASYEMTYDPRRARIVMLDTYFATVWEWNGRDWERKTPATADAPPTSEYKVAYDPVNESVLAFSEDKGTWSWNGTQWTSRGVGLGRLNDYALGLDPIRQRVVMFGSWQGYGTTWEWNGSTWTNTTPVDPNPWAEYRDELVFDGVGLMLISNNGGTLGTWRYDGASWTELAPGASDPVNSAGAAYDSIRDRVVLVGLADYGSTVADTFEWSGAAWTRVLAKSIGPRAGAGVAFDARDGRGVLFGGGTGMFITPLWPPGAPASTDNYDETWLFDGRQWLARAPATRPPAMWKPQLAHDPLRGRTVLHGGIGELSQVYDDTWEWDGTTWHLIAPAARPPASKGARLAFDPVTGHVVRFDTLQLGAVWDWDGATWTPRPTTATAPSSRIGAALAIDPLRGRALAFGGGTGTSLDETWQWDGASWTRLFPAHTPTARTDATLIYDPHRRELLLVGGLAASGWLADVWAWDGADWREVPTPFAPPAGGHAAIMYDPPRRQLLWFGGSGDDHGETRADVWTFAAGSSSAPADRCAVNAEDSDGDGLAGCADPDCWGRCTPLCMPGATCEPAWPRCGDGACGAVEDEGLCPADCAAP